jgi:tetratricopeptide (TPR) repeat protein
MTGGSFRTCGADAALQGAEVLITKIQSELSAQPAIANSAEDPVLAAFRTDMDAFRKTAATLPAPLAADAWLALADRFWKLPPPPPAPDRNVSIFGNSQSPEPLSFQGILAAIPGPETWPLIQAKLDLPVADTAPDALARSAVLRATFAFLTRDPARIRSALDVLGRQSGSLDRYSRDRFKETLRSLDEQAARFEGKSEDPVALFEKAFTKATQGDDSDISVQMPELLPLAGEDKTAALIRKVLKIHGMRLEVEGPATHKLALEIALGQVKSLPSPQWALADSSAEGVALFEGMLKKFGTPQSEEEKESIEKVSGVESPSDEPARGWNGYRFRHDFEIARLAYIFGLLRLNRSEDALKMVLPLKEDEVSSYQFTDVWKHNTEVPPALALATFLGQWLEARPEIPLWVTYVQLSTEAGQPEQARALIDRTAARHDLNAIQRFQVVRGKAAAFLSVDQTEAAMALWRTLCDVTATNEIAPVQNQLAQLKLGLGSDMCRLGSVLQKPEWVDEGLALGEAARTALLAFKDPDASPSRDTVPSDIFDGLLKMNRFTEAEQLVWKALGDQLEQAGQKTPGRPRELLDLTPFLTQLVELYDQADRPADVLTLFDKAPWWGSATNLADLAPDTLQVPAAAALHAAGRDAEAWSILTSYLAGKPGDDKAYAVLVKIPNQDLPAFLDRLYARDRFEERPLIWKASLLLKAGNLDEAEAVARQALKIDPTDGEQPDGDRVRGYAVLGDILAARGKTEDADFFRKVVKSVRIAEEGDAMNAVGLTARSLKLYAEAQTYFADAYCVQWRLAERLQAMGRIDEAQKHYQIAFERMPEQFGQVASLCFGCMGAFNNPESRSAAEVVLTRLVTNSPARPPVFYLLGQLREEQNRWDEAYAHYRKAVELDPDYLDAWEKINGLRERIALPAAERDAILLRMMRLDPLGRHIGIQPEDLTDMKGLWTVLTEAQVIALPVEKALLPLPAAIAAAAQAADEPADPFSSFSRSRFIRYSYYSHRTTTVPAPGEMIASTPFLRGLNEVQSTLGLSCRKTSGPSYHGYNRMF